MAVGTAKKSLITKVEYGVPGDDSGSAVAIDLSDPDFVEVIIPEVRIYGGDLDNFISLLNEIRGDLLYTYRRELGKPETTESQSPPFTF